MNESTADFICTAVTIGFLKAKPDTKFIYEVPGDRKNHEVLQKALQCVDLQVHVNGGQGQAGVNTIVISQQAAKMNQPLIITRPGGSVDQATIERIGKRLKGVTAFFEQQFDKMIYKKKQDGKVVSENLPGAYIGGLLTGDLNEQLILNIMTPSNLFVRGPYRQMIDYKFKTIQISYDGALAIRMRLAEILTAMPGTFENKVIALSDVVTERIKEISEGELFSSCHGLITSLFYRDTPPGAFHVEYSLGHSTCKVASCLPCSMFAVSNRTPAHATHFGRGDNWNFPEDVYLAYRDHIEKGQDIDKFENKDIKYAGVREWHKNIIKWYNEGFAVLEKHCNNTISDNECLQNAKSNPSTLPLVFLDALTHEKSFLNRITETLGKKNA